MENQHVPRFAPVLRRCGWLLGRATFAAGLLFVLGMSNGYARSSDGREVNNFCRNSNPFNGDNCTLCHRTQSGSGFNSAGNSFRRDELCVFCPNDPRCAPPEPTCTDNDRDDYFAQGNCGTARDCNDRNASINPGATEDCTDRIDNDCDGRIDAADPNAVECPVQPDCTDSDGDGFSPDGGSCGPRDCNDRNASVNPGAAENCTDRIDNNCNNLVDNADPNAVGCTGGCRDADGDGFSSSGGTCGPMDCNDGNRRVNPGARERCGDRIDNNCNGRVDSRDPACARNDDDDDDDDDDRRGNRGGDADDDDDRRGNRGGDADDDDDRRGGNAGNNRRGGDDDDGDRRERRGGDDDDD